jgi:serralysin
MAQSAPRPGTSLRSGTDTDDSDQPLFNFSSTDSFPWLPRSAAANAGVAGSGAAGAAGNGAAAAAVGPDGLDAGNSSGDLDAGAAGSGSSSDFSGPFTPVGSSGISDTSGGPSGTGGGSTEAFLLNYNGALHNPAPFSGNAEIDAALIGSQWGSTVGTAHNLTFSFPTNANQYQAGYGSQGAGGFSTNPGGFLAFNAQQQTAARYALNQLAEFSGLSFTEITETTSAHATIRFSQTTDANLGSAHAGFPTAALQAGDVWMGTQNQPFYTTPQPGNWGQATIMHELGHAVGLKHGHQDYTNTNLQSDLISAGTRYGSGALPANHDGQSWSLMTYRSDPGNSVQFDGDGFNQPQTYMQDDIAAVQYLYGANYGASANNSATTYTFSTTTGQMFINGVGQTAPTGNIVYRTIWDGGGTDTYDLSNYSTNLTLDLRPGEFSNFGMQLANNRAYQGGTNFAPGNIANALLYQGNTASLIENAIGGVGNDTFRGNAASNTLNGNGGFDTVVFGQNRSAYSFTESNNHNYTSAASGEGSDTLQSIERFQFADITVTDDIIGGQATAQSVAVGGSNTGNHQFTGDQDWFSTSLVAGHNYIIKESGSPTGEGTLTDTLVGVHNSAGTLLYADDDSGVGLNSVVAVHANSNGTYYVDAGAYSSTTPGTYSVTVQDLGVGSAASHFQYASGLALNSFGPAAGGWTTQNGTPRFLGNANGDDQTDIFGFGGAGVYIANGHNGVFDNPTFALDSFGAAASAGGWTSQYQYPRAIAQVDNLSYSDIIGFGSSGVYEALGTGGGTFGPVHLALASFGALAAAGGWSNQDLYPRVLGDVNHDGMDDIVGFGSAGTYVALATGSGNFGAIISNPGIFGAADTSGGWVSFDRYPRALADVNGDGRADIVGFGANGVYVALSNGDGHFADAILAINSFGASDIGGGWISQNQYPRELADVNQDGRADIVGFGGNGIYIATGNPNGTFNAPTFDLQAFAASGAAGGWTSQDAYPRLLADLTGDQVPDIVAFGGAGVYVSPDYNFHIV